MNDESAPAPKQPIVILTTPRLILRTAIERDIPIMRERILGDDDVMRHVFQGGPMTEEKAEEMMRKHFTFGDSLTGIAILTERPTGDIIGFAGLFPCAALEADDFEIGFVLARRAWGKGIASEIGEAQLAFGFGRLGRARLLALASAENTASIRTLEKLGMRHHSDVMPSGRSLRRVYCIGAGEWRERHP
jgi:[ribosomal protein S5]-alanine N-acetyltransferase